MFYSRYTLVDSVVLQKQGSSERFTSRNYFKDFLEIVTT